jgi:serine/threonine protein kinase
VDHRADIYALGVVFYQMLTGELPGKNIEAPSKKVQIDVRLDEVVLRALEKNPELRYQQVSEVKTMVETIEATKSAPIHYCPMRSTNTLYKDGLIEITDQEIVFHRYYFPLGGDKHVPLNHIERIQARPPSFFGGSWRIWGSGDLRTWFPLDGARPSRDTIFIAFLRGRFRRIGFTVEDSKKVAGVLKERGLFHD